MHDVAGKNVKDQQEDQRDSDDEQHDADNHVNQAAVIGEPIVRHFSYDILQHRSCVIVNVSPMRLFGL